MARTPLLPVIQINISASPHPEGIYLALFKRAARKVVPSRSKDAGMITSPQEVTDRFYAGRILIWTEIDLNGPWLDIESEDDLAEALRSKISIPATAKPNYRSFDYVLDVKRHRVIIESRNDVHESLGPTTARNLLFRLMSRDIQGRGAPNVEVTVIPDEGAVEKILNLPGLRTLTVRVVRPNPDDSSTEARRRVLAELEKQGAAQLEARLVKSTDAPALKPSAQIVELANVAAENGYVRGEGRLNGRKISASTDAKPQFVYVPRTEGASFFERIARTFNFR